MVVPCCAKSIQDLRVAKWGAEFEDNNDIGVATIDP